MGYFAIWCLIRTPYYLIDSFRLAIAVFQFKMAHNMKSNNALLVLLEIFKAKILIDMYSNSWYFLPAIFYFYFFK